MHPFRLGICKWAVPVLLLISISTLLPSCKQKQRISSKEDLHQYVSIQLDSLYALTGDGWLRQIKEGDSTINRHYFLDLRLRYKRIEAALEYFMPGTAKGLNGPALPEVEVEEHKENEPTGLQVVETFMFPEYQAGEQAEMIRAARNLHAMCYRASQVWEVTSPNEKQWMDATFYELIRIATMGITGFDTPSCLTSIKESATALQFAATIFSTVDHTAFKKHALAFEEAIQLLAGSDDFNGFDRAHFLRHYWQPLFVATSQWKAGHDMVAGRSAIRPGASNLFGNKVLDVAFYAPDSLHDVDEEIMLGKQLFYDTRLSANNRFSCATCHQPDKYFTDQLALSENIHGNKLARNTPTLVNAALQTSFFWDMRALNLETQARDVIDNPLEMHGNLDAVAERLNADSSLLSAFRRAYGNNGLRISPAMVTGALAAYQRTLIDYDSPFDAYMNGDDKAISVDAIAGFNLFMGKAKCATCHFPPSFAGLVPPYFDKMESEIIGVPSHASNRQADKDEGRFVIHPVEAFRNAFKTPTVRNAAHTFPYMHNGVYQTLEQVVDFYNKGGGAGLGLEFTNQSLPPEPLRLTEREVKQLVAFMHALSGKIIPHSTPAIAANTTQ